MRVANIIRIILVTALVAHYAFRFTDMVDGWRAGETFVWIFNLIWIVVLTFGYIGGLWLCRSHQLVQDAPECPTP